MATCQEMCDDIKVKLCELSCPFTWELADISLQRRVMNYFSTTIDDDEMENDIPITHFIITLVKCYECVISADMDLAETKLREATMLLENIQERNESYHLVTVIKHIFHATECHYLYEIDDQENLDKIFKIIRSVSSFNENELSALEGCKSLAYSMYHEFGINQAINAVNKALKKDQNNALWHFILAKNLRRQRRAECLTSSPRELERDHFKIAYELSKNPIFGVYFVQMQTETQPNLQGDQYVNHIKQKEQEAMMIYKEMIKLNTSNYKILLRIALGFIRIKFSNQLLHASYCLDIVDELHPEHPACYHYRGLLYARCGEYKEALKYYKLASEKYNFVADLQYAEYGWMIGEVNPIKHLLSLLHKYKELGQISRQRLFLHLATCYYNVDNDILNAGKYYLKAIDINPSSNVLSSYYKYINFVAKNGIYNFIRNQFLFIDTTRFEIFDIPLKDIFTKLRSACDSHLMTQGKLHKIASQGNN